MLKRISEKPASSGKNFEPQNLEAGEHEGRLVYVADLGLQERNYKNDIKPAAQQITLGIEIPGNPVTFDGEKKPRLLWTKPFNIFYSMHEKGVEYAMYKVFNPSAKDGTIADWEAQLGKPCSVVITHTPSKEGDRKFDNIQSLVPIPAKYQNGVAQNELKPCIGDSDNEANAAQLALYGLAKYVYDKRLKGGATTTVTPKSKPVADVSLEEYDDSDIPF